MVALGAGATHGVDFRLHDVADFQRALLERAVMADHIGLHLERVRHRKAHARVGEQARVANLATRFRVERRVIQHDHRLLARLHFLDRRAIHVQGDDLRVVEDDFFVAVERGLRARIFEALRHLELAGRARLVALARHGFVESGFVDRHFAFAAHVCREIQRETVGVVQLERQFAVERLAALRVEIRQRAFEDRHAVLDGLEEALFFLTQHVGHALFGFLQFRVSPAHLRDQIGHQTMEERTLLAQLVAVTDRAAHDAAQHVTAAFVARNHAVDDQERARADVVGDHLQRVVGQIGHTGFTASRIDQRLEQVDLVVTVHVLQHRCDTLRPMPVSTHCLGSGGSCLPCASRLNCMNTSFRISM